jgi:hypothetical protein
MQPRAEEIQRVLSTFAHAPGGGQQVGSRRRSFALVVQGSSPLMAEIRELRGACAMIDIGSSVFTLAYSDILGIDPAGEGGLRLTVRPGCFASHVAARLGRAAPRPWSGTMASSPLAKSPDPAAYVREAEGSTGMKKEGGIAQGDPAGTESARQESVENEAVRTRRR